MHDLTALVNRADEAELLAAVDGLCATRRWHDLVDLARRCRDAIELGRQLWPVAMHIDYRLALEGPPEYAGRVLEPGAGRFSLGPLTEVAASVHPWEAIAPHLDDPLVAAVVAQERAIRGEDLAGRAPLGELPSTLAAFEPSYALPRYSDRSAAFPEPEAAVRSLPPMSLPSVDGEFSDEAAAGLAAVAEPWATQSAGMVRAVGVTGSAAAAVAALGTGRTWKVRGQQVSAAEALALLQWAGASGGAYGRRRGGAAGRFNAWWAAATVAGLGWPDHDEDLDEFTADLASALDELRWWRWEPSDAPGGWRFRLAVEDPADELAWAVEATDQLDDADV